MEAPPPGAGMRLHPPPQARLSAGRGRGGEVRVPDTRLTDWDWWAPRRPACWLGTRDAEVLGAGWALGPAGRPLGVASVAGAVAGAAAMEAELASQAGAWRQPSAPWRGGAGLGEAGKSVMCPRNMLQEAGLWGPTY